MSDFKGLFPMTAERYGPDHQRHLLDQYRLYVESAEKVSEWRNGTNNYFITVNSALVALYGLLGTLATPSRGWSLGLPVAGIAACVAWWLLVASYRHLNTAKFKIIHELEKQLPVALFDHEWKLLKEGKSWAYRPVSHIEAWIPFAFLGLHIVLAKARFS